MGTRLSRLALSLGLLPIAVPCTGAPPPLTPSSLSPCALRAGEIATALGVTVEEEQAADMSWPGGRDVGCLYTFQGTSVVLSVRQTWDPAAGSGAAPQAAEKPDPGVEVVPGDPDGAAWRVRDAEGNQDVELTYTRGHVHTRVSAHNGSFDVTDMRQRITRLRRVP